MASGVEPNMHVTLAYVLRNLEGEILDASGGDGGEPMVYVHGYGMIVPGLEAALVGMKVGQRKKIKLTAAEAYGEHDEELVLEIDRSEFPEGVAEGDEFVAESPDGDEVAMRVVEVKDDAVVVDANHPLAGIALEYEVEVQKLRKATEKEIESAAAELEAEHEHLHGPDCDHDHSHGHEHPHAPAAGKGKGSKGTASATPQDVVPLGKKPKRGPVVH